MDIEDIVNKMKGPFMAFSFAWLVCLFIVSASAALVYLFFENIPLTITVVVCTLIFCLFLLFLFNTNKKT